VKGIGKATLKEWGEGVTKSIELGNHPKPLEKHTREEKVLKKIKGVEQVTERKSLSLAGS